MKRIITIGFLTGVTVFFVVVKMPSKAQSARPEPLKIEHDVYTEVFGVDYGTEFVPGYYETSYIIDDEIPLTEEEQKTIQDICKEYNVCYELVLALIERESAYRKDAVSASGTCHGLMQINPVFHDCDGLYEADSNVRTGVRYLAKLFNQYEDPGLVLDIYHGDKKAFERYERGQLSSYAKGIFERSEELERRHNK